jgi:hypothetical protein
MHTEFAASPMDRRHTLPEEMADLEAVEAIRSARANGQLRYVVGPWIPRRR